MNKLVIRILVLGIFLICLSVPTAQAVVVWDFHDGQLFGAQNVDVGGTFYDVAFEDGRCVDIFANCAAGDFAFDTYGTASNASLALLSQVLRDFPTREFDSDPTFVAGCENDVVCWILTPYTTTPTIPPDALLSAALNWAPPFDDFEDDTFLGIFDVPDDRKVYAVWTPVNPIPIPAAVWLFGTALIGLIGFGRRKAITT